MLKNLVKNRKSILINFLIFFLILLFPAFASADSGYYESYNVNVDFNNDSTYTVTESVSINFSGTFRKVFRGITLVDEDIEKLCIESNLLQCGGFEYMEFLGVFDEAGNRVPDSEIEIEKVYESGEDRFKITWYFDDDGRVFNNEYFNYSIKYKVYGGLGFFEDYDLFYWDMLPPERPSGINNSLITLNFPQGFVFDDNGWKVLTDLGYSYLDYDISNEGSVVKIKSKDIKVDQNLTVALKINKGLIQKPGKIILESKPDPINLKINGVQLDAVSKELGGIPAGNYELEFFYTGYDSQKMNITMAQGEEKSIKVELEESLITKILFWGNIICGILSCLIFPVGVLWIFMKWRKSGRDEFYRDTIVPEYTPPDDIKPYLLGAVKDEKVDMIDITATLIDVARMGYIKIREFKNQGFLGIGGSTDYELVKLKDFSSLDENEKLIMDSMFSGKEKLIMSIDLTNLFYLKVPSINKSIDKEMVKRKYYKESPEDVRNKYIGIGAAGAFISGGVLFFGFAFLLIIPGLFITVISIFLLSIGLSIVGNYMPAKTKEGAKILNRIKGFRMYLYTAERFRVQDLTPETFEKFLPYAMVFGIEKQWGERFKDIYKKAPDWYETSSWNTFNTIYMINSLSNFSTYSSRTLSSRPQSSSSGGSRGGSIGGGWSGGGGFSGSFSGGGGGGGSSGWG